MDRKSGGLTNEVKDLIVSLKIENHKTCEIVRLLNISESTVRSVWNKYIKRGSVENLPRVGRSRRLSHRDENWILHAVKSNRYRTLNDITLNFNEGKDRTETVHKCTVQRFLNEQGYKRKVVRKRMVVREVNRKKRLSWFLEKRRLTVDQQWNKVIFSDESQVVIGENHRVYVWRKANEAFLPQSMCPPPLVSVELQLYGVGMHNL